MGHRTLVGGTAYNISSGKSLVSGTVYNISKGNTLVGGTAYNINFKKDVPTAMLYSDGNFVFQYGNKVANGKTLTASYTGFENTIYENFASIIWNSKMSNIKKVYFNNKISPISLYGWFHGANNLTSLNRTNLDMVNVVNMRGVFYNCQKLTGSPVCDENVDNMSLAYYNCRNITGAPVCGNNVTNMAYAYYNCTNITGAPVCRNNVTNMAYAYCYCSNITGVFACGNNVTNMAYTFYNCRNVLGGVVGNNVINMSYTFYECQNFSQVPIVGSNVVNMDRAYYNAFSSKTGNIYIYSPNVTNMTNSFYRLISHRINIYVPAGSATNTTIHSANKYNTSLDGWSFTWTKNNTCSYNTLRNIYVYPVADVDAARKKNGQ